MADNVYKLVFNYIESSGATWSEVYYRTASSAAVAVIVNGKAIAARRSMLHSTCLLRNIRSFNVAASRDSFTATQNYPGLFVDTTSEGPAPAGLSAVVAFTVGTGRSVLRWMRGLPGALVREDPNTGFPAPPAILTKALQAFGAEMGNSGCGTRVLQPSQKYQGVQVTSNPTLGTTTISYNVAQGQAVPVFTGVVPQNRLVIGLASKKDLPGLNGHWTVLAATTPTGTPQNGSVTVKYVMPNGLAALPFNGYIKAEGYSAVNGFIGAGLAYYGTHSTRSIFSNSRGAKHAARLRVLA